jgi:hypothetical protein
VKNSKRKKSNPNPEIMRELLDQESVKEYVDKMTPEELAFYKELLVSQGIYARYAKERKS